MAGKTAWLNARLATAFGWSRACRETRQAKVALAADFLGAKRRADDDVAHERQRRQVPDRNLEADGEAVPVGGGREVGAEVRELALEAKASRVPAPSSSMPAMNEAMPGVSESSREPPVTVSVTDRGQLVVLDHAHLILLGRRCCAPPGRRGWVSRYARRAGVHGLFPWRPGPGEQQCHGEISNQRLHWTITRGGQFTLPHRHDAEHHAWALEIALMTRLMSSAVTARRASRSFWK